MPFAMTHINIALEIMAQFDSIERPGDFLLGALAPDAVHYRENYNSDMKFKSHLCVGSEKWGFITNNQGWEDNVKKFIKENITKDNKDFILGYCSHILADIQNNIKIWTPFKESIKGINTAGIGKKYHQESNDIDYELYLKSSKETIFDLIKCGRSFDILDVVLSTEIDQMRNEILHERFSERENIDTHLNEYVTLPIIEKFILEESDYIFNLLQG